VYVAAIFTIPPLKGDRIAVITHAGGPGVMLTDILVKNGMKVPQLQGDKAAMLLSKLYPGSTVSNPIDFLATGTADQLGEILDAVENDFEEIDAAVVVFGTTGMWSVDDVYMLLHEKMRTSRKPIFPILPSAIQAAVEVSHFQSMGHVNFTDEVSFGYVLSRVNKMKPPFPEAVLPKLQKTKAREIIDHSPKCYLSPGQVFELLQSAGIATVAQAVVSSKEEAFLVAKEMGFPLVLKVSGILHKSDSGGVVPGITSFQLLKTVFEKLIAMPGANGVIIQQQLTGSEIYVGAKAEDKFGHQVLCGLGGIFIEIFKDISSGLAPVGRDEAISMIRHLRSYPLIKGIRGKEGVNEELIIDTILKISALLQVVPEITEMDINPLIGNSTSLIAVDARICIS
jgi:acetyltransferase